MQAGLQITALISSDIRRTPYSEKELQSSGFELPHEQMEIYGSYRRKFLYYCLRHL